MGSFDAKHIIFIPILLFSFFLQAHETEKNEKKEVEVTQPKNEKGEVENIVVYEGFENGIPPGWTQHYIPHTNGTNVNWDTRTGAGVIAPPNTIGVPDTAAVGDKNLVFQWESVGNETWLITSPIDLEFIVNPVLSFYHTQAEWEPGHFDKLTILYRKGEEGNWQVLQSYDHPIEVWTHRSISLDDHESDEFYIALVGLTGWGSGVCVDEFTITETGEIPKELNQIETEQASLNFIPTGTINNPILRSRIRVTGNSGSLALEEYVAHSLNTNDSDITNEGIKLYLTDNEFFNTDQLVAQTTEFENGEAVFEDINLELPTGYSYLWLTFDIDEYASHGNHVNAYIPAGGITIGGEEFPGEDQNPPGSREIYETIFHDNFDTDRGWILTGEWERDIPQGLGGSSGYPGPSYPVSGEKIIGTDLTGQGEHPGDFEPGLPYMAYQAISPALDCFYYKDITLTFQRWLNTEYTDKAYIHISTDNGNSWDQIWVNETHYHALSWTEQTYSLPPASRKENVLIMFSIGPTDNTNNYSGWNIDDLIVTGSYVTKDVGVSQWLAPGPSCNMSEDETVEVRVKNYGAEPVSDPIPLGFSLDGGETWHMDTLYDHIEVGGYIDHTFAPTADFSTPGRYDDIIVKTFWEEDQYPSNDALDHSIFSVPYIELPYSQPFIDSDGLWTGYGENSSWQWGEPGGSEIGTAKSGTKAWFTNPDGAYPAMEASWLESPCFNFSQSVHPVLEFYVHTHTLENTDGLSLQYSLDEGESWQVLPPYSDDLAWGWYNDDEISTLQEAFSVDYGWHGDNEGWQRVRAVMDTSLAQEEFVKFRWVFASHDFDEESSSWEGIGVDAVSIFDAPHDIGVSAITHPVDACELSQDEQVTIRIENFGLNTLDSGTEIPTGIDINSYASVYESFILENNLEPGSTVDFTFEGTFDLTEQGNHSITAYTMLPGDSDFYVPGEFNDTLSTQVTVFGYPELDLGDDIYTTMADTLLLDAGAGFEAYLWQDGSSEQTYQVSSLFSNTYHVEVTDHNYCKASDTLNVIARDLALNAILSPESNCELSDTELLTAQLKNTGGEDLEEGEQIDIELYYNDVLYDDLMITLDNNLQPGQTLDFTFENPLDLSQNGAHNLKVKHLLPDANPENDILDTTIWVYGYPAPYIGDTLYSMTPLDITLDAGGDFNEYTWQDGSDGQYYEVNDPFSEWYSVIVSDEHGCMGEDSVLLVTYDIEILEVTEPLDACELTQEEFVGVRLINHGPETFFAGDTFPLALEYDDEVISIDTLILEQEWLADETLDFSFSEGINMEQEQSYDFRVYQIHRDANADNDTLAFTVYVHGYPEVFLPSKITTDYPENVTLDPGSGYASYLWQDGSIEQIFDVQDWGSYWVEVSNDFGCTSIAHSDVYPEVFDIAPDSLLQPFTFCGNAGEQEVKVRFKNSGYMPVSSGTEISLSYSLDNGTLVQESYILETTMQPEATRVYTFTEHILLDEPGEHLIEITATFDGDEIPENDTLAASFEVLSLPQPNLGEDIFTTAPEDIILDPGSGFVSYQWQDGSTHPTYQVSEPGSDMYHVTVEDEAGCHNTDSVHVITYNLKMESIAAPASHCMLSDNETVIVEVLNQGYDDFEQGSSFELGYHLGDESASVTEEFALDQDWLKNTSYTFTFETTADLSSSSSYTFTAFVSTPNASTESDTLATLIEITGQPQVDLGPDIYTQAPDTVILDAGPGFASYYWQDGHEDRHYPVNNHGWKWVRVTDEFGCIGADTLYVGPYTNVDEEISGGQHFNIYPNPANQQVTLEFRQENHGQTLVELIDMKGVVHLRKTFNGQEVQRSIDIFHLEPGIYFISFTGQSHRESHRLIILE